MKKFIERDCKILLEIIMLCLGIKSECMAILSAAGWRYNVRQGNYPELLGVYSFWMFLGAGLILLSMILCMLGKKARFYKLNFISAVFSISGLISCMTVLSKFCVYADQNFSGIGDSMKPVSELYRDRISPVIVPVILILILSIWNFINSREYRIELKQKRLAELNAEAPKIISEDD
ncbi:MAG: hypothetical protein IJ642_11830 [Oscillospiraceae bacterium]|nr:hypothetical protein [Oscillospiraceae bacterium]